MKIRLKCVSTSLSARSVLNSGIIIRMPGIICKTSSSIVKPPKSLPRERESATPAMEANVTQNPATTSATMQVLTTACGNEVFSATLRKLSSEGLVVKRLVLAITSSVGLKAVPSMESMGRLVSRHTAMISPYSRTRRIFFALSIQLTFLSSSLSSRWYPQ